MKYKVLIVDDETIVRKGIATVVNWNQLGCEVIGEAGNGHVGMEMIRKHKPDIIIADINMPKLSGLDMIKETLDVVKHSKIIILTGYRDFDYIQEAMRIGAFDYLLKPSKLDILIKTIKRALLELKYTHKLNQTKAKLIDNFEKAKPVLKEKLLKDIIIKTVSLDEGVIKELKTYDLSLEEYYVILIEMGRTKDIYSRQIYKFGLYNTFEEVLGESFTYESVDIGNNKVIFIVSSGEKDFKDKILSNLEEMMELMAKCFEISLTASMSTLAGSIYELPRKATECFDSIGYGYYLGEGSIILAEDFELDQHRDISELEIYSNELLKYIKLGDKNNIDDLIQEISNALKNNTSYHPVDVNSFLIRVIYNIYNYVLINKQLDEKSYGLDGVILHNKIQAACKVEDLIAIIKEFSHEVANDTNNLRKESLNNIINKAIHYIKNNYTKSITLNDISQHVNISAYYLSRMFKKEMGKNFSEYLIELRMNKAKEFLKNPEFRLYEIADMIGIKDSHYFSRVFKKNFGITPTQYRAQCIESDGEVLCK